MKLCVEYDGRSTHEMFKIVKKCMGNKILLSNTLVKRLTLTRERIPVECVMNTGKNDPMSWNRPIKSIRTGRILML